jgi:hypothetical protein
MDAKGRISIELRRQLPRLAIEAAEKIKGTKYDV